MLVPEQGSVVQDADVDDLATPLSPTMTRGQRKTHKELHDAVFRYLGKRRARSSKSHLQLHNDVFQDGVVWTPSGYTQDLSSLITKRRGDIPVPEPQQHRPSQDIIPRPSRSRSGTTTVQSPDKVIFPLGQPPALPPMSPLRVRSPGVPCQPSPAVSETPSPRISSPTSPSTHMRTTSARLSQAVRSMMPRGQRRSSSAALESPPPEDHRERAKDRQSPTRFLSLVDRRPAAVPPLPHANTSEFLTRAPRNPQTKESLVLQRARAYEQSTGKSLSQDTCGTGSLTTLLVMNQSPGTVGTKGTHSPFVLPPLPPMSAMTEVAEAIERSKVTFA